MNATTTVMATPELVEAHRSGQSYWQLAQQHDVHPYMIRRLLGHPTPNGEPVKSKPWAFQL